MALPKGTGHAQGLRPRSPAAQRCLLGLTRAYKRQRRLLAAVRCRSRGRVARSTLYGSREQLLLRLDLLRSDRSRFGFVAVHRLPVAAAADRLGEAAPGR